MSRVNNTAAFLLSARIAHCGRAAMVVGVGHEQGGTGFSYGIKQGQYDQWQYKTKKNAR
jgi:hypothetical protein